MSKQKYPRRMRAVRVANAVNKIEGVPVTAEAKKLSSLWAKGEITSEAMLAALIDKHSRPQIISSNELPIFVCGY